MLTCYSVKFALEKMKGQRRGKRSRKEVGEEWLQENEEENETGLTRRVKTKLFHIETNSITHPL